MILYHYTPECNLKPIKEHGLIPMFGLSWLTEDSNTEITVNMLDRCIQGRISISSDSKVTLKSFTEGRVIEPDLLSQYCNLKMIDRISDTTKWWYTPQHIEASLILKYEVYINNQWEMYNEV